MIYKGIYAIRNSLTGKSYVGSAKNVGKRWGAHRTALRKGSHSSKKLQNAWNKYGCDVFQFELLECVDDDLFLLAREQFWLWRTHAFESGYNCKPTAAGSLGFKHSVAARDLLSRLKTGIKKSPEARFKMSAYQSNRSPEHHAKVVATLRSPELIAKRAAVHTGAKRSLETRQKISAARAGKPLSVEHRANIAAGGRARWARKRAFQLTTI